MVLRYESRRLFAGRQAHRDTLCTGSLGSNPDNDIPDIIARFHNLDAEADRKRTEQSFFVPKEEIAANGYDLSINKYKETEYVPVEYPSTQEILADLHELEMEITKGLAELEEMV